MAAGVTPADGLPALQPPWTLRSLSDPCPSCSTRGRGTQVYSQPGESSAADPWESRALPLLSERDARLLGSAMLPLLARESPSEEERDAYERVTRLFTEIVTRAFEGARPPTVLPNGSSCFDTAVSGSDLDLLVETDLWVTKKIKNWMRQVFQGRLAAEYGQCKFQPGRKALKFKVSRRKSTRVTPLLLPQGRLAAEYGQCKFQPRRKALKFKVSLPPAQPTVPAASDTPSSQTCSSGAMASDHTLTPSKLSVDVLFVRSTLGYKPTHNRDVLAAWPLAKAGVQALKLFRREAFGLARLKSFAFDALVCHVMAECWEPSGLGEREAEDPELVAGHVLWMALSLLLQEEATGASLDRRLRPHLSFITGDMFDQGFFMNWQRRAKGLQKNLLSLVHCMAWGKVPPDVAPEDLLMQVFRGTGRRPRHMLQQRPTEPHTPWEQQQQGQGAPC